MSNFVVYGDQFRRIAADDIADGAPLSAHLVRTLGRNVNALKASVLCPRLVDEHLTTAISNGVATTTPTMIVEYPAIEVPAGYLHVAGKIRARKQPSASGNPTITIYSDRVSPVSTTGTIAVSASAASGSATVQSTDYQWYDLIALLRVDGSTELTYISVWGTNANAGASSSAEFTDLDLWARPIRDDARVCTRQPEVTSWR